MIKMNVSEIFNSCRLCLGKSNSYVDIFDANGEHGFRAAEVINEILQLDVFKDDGYPEIICNQCLSKIIDFKRFKCICLESKHKLQYAIAQKNGANPKCWTSNWYYSYGIQETIEKEKSFGMVTTDSSTNTQSEPLCVDDLTNIKPSQNPQIFWTNDGSGLFNSARVSTVPQVEVLMGAEIKGANNCSAVHDDRNAPFFQAETQNSKGSMYILDRIPKPEIEIPKITVKNEIVSTKSALHDQDGNSDDSCIVEYASSNSITPLKIEGNVSGRSTMNIGELIYKYEPVDTTLISSCTDVLSFPKASPAQLMLTKHCSTSTDSDRIAAKSFIGSQGNLTNLILKEEPGLLDEGSSQMNAVPKVPAVILDGNCSVDSLKCSECGKCFTDDALLRSHVESGECDKKVIYCIKCKKNISGLRRFQKHLAWCGIYQCPVCKNVYKGKEATRDHVRTHFPNRRYACSFCFERFEGRNDLILHVSNQHGNRTYKCDGCDKSYLKKVQYKKHILKCSKNIFVCNACNSPYLRKYPLKLHIWKYHMNPSVYKCNDCGKEFKLRSDYDMHCMNCNIKMVLGKITYKMV